MPFVRQHVDNLDRLNFAYYKSFPTVANKTSPNLITYHQINRDVRVWYKQCITQKYRTLVLTLKGYLGIYGIWVSFLTLRVLNFPLRTGANIGQ